MTAAPDLDPKEAESLARWLDGLGKQHCDMSETSHCAAVLRALLVERDKMRICLVTIRDFPFPEQDNMLSANMRKLAQDTLKICDPELLELLKSAGI